jgi:hypothetical protein
VRAEVIAMACELPVASGVPLSRWSEQIAAPFEWKFTRHDLHTLLAKADTAQPTPLAA